MTTLGDTLVVLLTAHIPSTPRPQGSMRSLVHKHTGRAITMHDPKTVEARAYTAVVLAGAWTDTGRGQPFDQAVSVSATFALPRPANHYWPAAPTLHRQARQVLRDDAPPYPTGAHSPDVDKACRLLGDALTAAGVIVDDALIVGWHATKQWTPHLDGYTSLIVRAAQ